MSPRVDAYARHQQARWLRPDAARWVRPDAARYLAPNADIGAIFPALERKYSPDQPRVPGGNPDGGQWTDGSLSGNLGLFQIKPRERRTDGVQLAGEPPPGIGHNDGPPLERSDIPQQRPETPSGRMKIVWAIARWVRRIGRYSPAVDIFFGAKDQVEWLKPYGPAMKSYSDPARTLDELQSRVTSTSEPGYEDHHIEERTLLRRLGFTWGEVNDPNNVVRIPTLKHYEISGWYGTPNEEFGGLTPRDYLKDKDAAERRRIGIRALIDAGVLKP